MSDPEVQSKSKRPPIWALIAGGILLLFLVIQLCHGLMFQEIGFFGMDFKFSSPSTAAPEKPKATRQFFVGRWQVEQQNGQVEGATFVDYFENGRFSGLTQLFQGTYGARMPVSGNWQFATTSDGTFHLSLLLDNGQQWNGNFRILDQDRIQNTDQNYVAVRVAH